MSELAHARTALAKAVAKATRPLTCPTGKVPLSVLDSIGAALRDVPDDDQVSFSALQGSGSWDDVNDEAEKAWAAHSATKAEKADRTAAKADNGRGAKLVKRSRAGDISGGFRYVDDGDEHASSFSAAAAALAPAPPSLAELKERSEAARADVDRSRVSIVRDYGEGRVQLALDAVAALRPSELLVLHSHLLLERLGAEARVAWQRAAEQARRGAAEAAANLARNAPPPSPASPLRNVPARLPRSGEEEEAERRADEQRQLAAANEAAEQQRRAAEAAEQQHSAAAADEAKRIASLSPPPPPAPRAAVPAAAAEANNDDDPGDLAEISRKRTALPTGNAAVVGTGGAADVASSQ